MDRALVETVILGAAFVPWLVEVFFQLRLQARFLAALPEPMRAALPRHPRRPALAFLGSWRFQMAFWRCIRRDLPGDAADIAALKRRMRATMRREAVWVSGGVAVLAVLIAVGWRPEWP
jgi:hypothetical protein